MFIKLFNNVFIFLMMIPILKKYGGIWKLKEYLQASKVQSKRLLLVYEAYFRRTGSWIGVNSQIIGIPYFPHGCTGIFISDAAKIGRDSVIFQHVTIGSNTLKKSKGTGSPVIGNSVYIGAGAKIIGGIKIGDNCRIGANAVVYNDMPANSVAVLSPTRIIQKKSLDNRFYSKKKWKMGVFQ